MHQIYHPPHLSCQVGGAKKGAEMSRTDNTRPYDLQADDLSLPGYVYHNHLTHHCRQTGINDKGKPIYIRWTEAVSCDYRPDNNTRDFKSRWSESPRCSRQIYFCGGRNYDGGNAKKQNRSLERMNRHRVNRELHGFKRLGMDADPDLLPSASFRSGATWFD